MLQMSSCPSGMLWVRLPMKAGIGNACAFVVPLTNHCVPYPVRKNHMVGGYSRTRNSSFSSWACGSMTSVR